MDRLVTNKLRAWRSSQRRMPLMVQGARQVGKTWVLREFGRTDFGQVAYLDFMHDEVARAVFGGSLEPDRLLTAIQALTAIGPVDQETLIIFDEIQECPRALMSLKTFSEQRPDVAVVAAGSLLGVALRKDGSSYPVGKVQHLSMNPMTYYEFLGAMGQKSLQGFLDAGDTDMIAAFAEKYTDLLRQYYYVGGMPAAVAEYASSGSFSQVRAIQDDLLVDYERDFSKHANPKTVERIRLVWESAPNQLARENKKFVYSAVRSGARARGYEEAIQWLVDAGLLLRVARVKKAGLPLAAYEDRSAFKLYLLDVGLLGAASRLDAATVVNGNHLFTEFKGSLAENYVCQELVAGGKVIPYYWSAENSSGEVDFVCDYAGQVLPIEVKAERNLRAKSLTSFMRRYGIEQGVRLSLSGFGAQGRVTDMPLFAASMLPEYPFVREA